MNAPATTAATVSSHSPAPLCANQPMAPSAAACTAQVTRNRPRAPRRSIQRPCSGALAAIVTKYTPHTQPASAYEPSASRSIISIAKPTMPMGMRARKATVANFATSGWRKNAA